MDFIVLVICKHTGSSSHYLFQAPANSFLKDGEKVFVETQHGIRQAVVVDTYSCELDGMTYNFVVKAAGAKTPLKRVIGRMKIEKLKYPEEVEIKDEDIPFADIVYPEGEI